MHYWQQLSDFYINEQNYNVAVEVEEKWESIHLEEEKSYFTLMKLYDILNNTAVVEEQYLLLKNILQEQFEVGSGIEIEDWYIEWIMSRVEVLN